EIRKLIHQDNLEIFQNLAQFYLAVQEKTLDNSEQKELINVKIQILRAIGNLAIDDDEARQRLLDTGVVSNIIKDLDSKPDLNVMKFMTGCLLNISLGYAPMRQFMLKENCVSALMNSVNVLNLKNNEMAVYFGLRQLSNLFDEDEGTKLFAQNYNNLIHLVDIIDFYIKNSGVYDVSILEHTCEILELMLTENENYQVKFVDSQNYLKIINFIRNANDIKERYSDNEKEFTNICTVIERIIVLISSHDKNMVLFDEEDFIGDMLSWLAQNEDLQLKSCSALVLGNLIRSSENSIKAVEFYKLHEKIYKILEIAQDLSIQHAMVGLLKNLSIPAENKETIGKLLFIKLIAPFLEKFTAPPLQYNTIGVLKHLSNRNEHNALAICDEKNSMNGILPIVRLKKAIDKTDNPGIRSEGTRALINVIKAICNKKDNYEKYSQLLKENSATEAVIDLVKQTQFIVLQNEGLIALTVL
ncbi:ARM repeat-containing protein, partial [Neoconidiobolus thromboides FSU 785]